MPHRLLSAKFHSVSSIFWKRCSSKNNVVRKLGAVIDVIFKCTKSRNPVFNVVYQEKKSMSGKFSDDKGRYTIARLYRDNIRSAGHMFEYAHHGFTFNPPHGWRNSKEELDALAAADMLHAPKKAGGQLYRKHYVDDNAGIPCTNLWDDIFAVTRVCDPMCGSGTTGVAAAKLKRKAILFDKNPDAVRIAKARLEAKDRTAVRGV